jgi:urease accessory protein
MQTVTKIETGAPQKRLAKWKRSFVAPACLAAATIVFCASPTPALAHINGAQGGFGSGFAHPLTGPDHFLAMFAVGLWGAQMGGRRVWTLPVAFPLIMAVAGILGMLGLALPDVEIGIALSIVALGSAIIAAWRPPEWIALALISIFAICHGYAHGVELPLSADPADYAIGFVLATGMIHVFGIGAGLVLTKPRKGKLVRMVGAAIAFGGSNFFAAAIS